MVALPVTAEFTSAQASSLVGERYTDWGYIIDAQSPVSARNNMILEAIIYFLGFSLVALTALLWLLPGSSFAPAIVGLKAALSYAAIMGGFYLTGVSQRGFSRAVQIDTSRKQIRTVYVNRKGDMTLCTVFEFSEIGSVFVSRRSRDSDGATLNIRFGKQESAVEIAKGTEEAMRSLWRRLLNDLHQETFNHQMPKAMRPATHKKPAPQFSSETDAMRRKVFSGGAANR